MKIKQPTILLLIALAALPCFAQSNQNSTDASFEELPVLKASEILRPEVLKGPRHTVIEHVPTYSGANQYVIDSEFGFFEADGNEMLLVRINEVNAIAQLKDVSRTDEYGKALAKAAVSPLVSAKNIVTKPVKTVTNVPKGIFKFVGRVGENVTSLGKAEGDDREGSKAQQLTGFSDAKRKIASKLGVDPYSTNPVLQRELNGITRASFLGGLTFQAATFPISGPAGAALSVTGTAANLDQLVSEKSPTDLKMMNRKMLTAMGVGDSEADRFLNNNAFSPTEETAFVLNLKALEGVANRAAFVQSAGATSSDEEDAIFCVRTAALMGQLHKDKPLARIAMLGNFPVCVARDGTVIVALQWDYAAWTPAAAAFTQDVEKLAKQSGKDDKNVLVALSGETSPRLRQELDSRGINLRDRLSPGPLK